MQNDSLGDRIKTYEDAFRQYLPIRMPVIIRIDGCHFHSYTSGCGRPFDQKLIDTMDETAMYLCKNIQNAAIAYTQSDEISILLINYKDKNTGSWFDNNVQKMCSVAAGMTSAYFTSVSHKIFGETKIATFDCRAFVVPREDVNNSIECRQQDATRNSIQMLARSLYSHKECNDKNMSDLQEMCFKKGKNWNDLPTSQKRGRCIVKEKYEKDGSTRSRWIVDNEIPIFHKEPNYINQYVFPPTEEDKEE